MNEEEEVKGTQKSPQGKKDGQLSPGSGKNS